MNGWVIALIVVLVLVVVSLVIWGIVYAVEQMNKKSAQSLFVGDSAGGTCVTDVSLSTSSKGVDVVFLTSSQLTSNQVIHWTATPHDSSGNAFAGNSRIGDDLTYLGTVPGYGYSSYFTSYSTNPLPPPGYYVVQAVIDGCSKSFSRALV